MTATAITVSRATLRAELEDIVETHRLTYVPYIGTRLSGEPTVVMGCDSLALTEMYARTREAELTESPRTKFAIRLDVCGEPVLFEAGS